MSRRVLVTGGAGFIGSHVAAAYVAAGDDVTILDDLSTGRLENVPTGARLVRADIRSREARACLATGGFAVLNHHAAQMDIRRSVGDPVFDADVNILGLLNLLEGTRDGGVRRLIVASSGGAVYAESNTLPVVEEAAKLPISPYGSAKLATEYYLATFARLYGLESVVLRYSNVYGPRQNPEGEAGVVAIFARRILRREPITIFGDGRQTRDLVYVSDVAEANLRASDYTPGPLRDLDSRAFNIATGIETAVSAVAERLAHRVGRAVEMCRKPARAGEVRRSALAIDKAVRELGWQPRTALQDGLASTLEAIDRRAGGARGLARSWAV